MSSIAVPLQFIEVAASVVVVQEVIQCACPNGRGGFGVWFEYAVADKHERNKK